MAYIETKNLTFTYPDCRECAVKNINIKINNGDFVLMMGKSGSGKSTLLKLLKKEIAPFGDINGSIEGNFSNISFVVQDTDSSFVSENVRGELAFALENLKMKNDKIAVKIGETSSFFNLSHLLEKKICDLSGGERASVVVAAAMITNPDLLILDEPFSQLDPKASHQLISLLKRVNDELGTAIVVASHISDGIVDLCDKMVILDKGKIIAQGSPKEIAENDNVLPFFPAYTSLFESRPLTVKEAVSLNGNFKEKSPLNKDFKEKTLELKNIVFAYGKNEKDILDRLSLTVFKGSVHSIIGANGSGKTTLLKVIAGIKKQYSGKVKLNGKVAYLPQNPRYLFTKDTVVEEIGQSSAKALFPDNYATRHPYDLSGGEMQKLAVAILLKQDFDIILMDEPVKSLDYFSKHEIRKIIEELTNKGKTVLMVTHDLDFAGEVSDFVSFLSDGIIALTGDRRYVFSSLDFYNTQIRRVTKSYLSSAVALEDIV